MTTEQKNGKQLPIRKQLENIFDSQEYKINLIRVIGNEELYKKEVARTILFAINNPAMQNINAVQIAKLAMQSYELGIPLNSEKLSYAVNFRDSWQLIPTAKGLRKKALFNKDIIDIRYGIVYQDDTWDYGDDSRNGGVWYTYRANFDSDKHGDIAFIKGAYCIIEFKNSKCKVEYMSKKQLNTVKGKAKTQNVWNEFAEEMSKKAVIKRALKNETIPEIEDIVELDNELFDVNKKHIKPIQQTQDEFSEETNLLKPEVELKSEGQGISDEELQMLEKQEQLEFNN